MADWEAAGFGLYIHWPFCQAKCPYCDFNSHVAAQIDQDRWCDSYLSEVDRVAAETKGRTLVSVFFGGGTPSLMEPRIVGRILDRIGRHWAAANRMEITLEANPTSVEADRFAGFRAAGVNRVSLGVQALNNQDLRRLGRLHSAAEAIAAFEIARGSFDQVSFDLIYARQEQTLAAWETELRQALDLAVDHLSLYQLTIEPGTAFGARAAAGNLRGLPDEDLAADMFDLTQDLCHAAGLPAYEVSNHASDMAQSRHNLLYWTGGDYGGIGPGAHGRLTLGDHRFATETHLAPGKWLETVETRGNGESSRTPVTTSEQADEMLLMGLRLSRGLDVARYERLNGRALNGEAVAELAQLGLVRQDGARLVATLDGRRVLNSVIRVLSDASSALVQ